MKFIARLIVTSPKSGGIQSKCVVTQHDRQFSANCLPQIGHFMEFYIKYSDCKEVYSYQINTIIHEVVEENPRPVVIMSMTSNEFFKMNGAKLRHTLTLAKALQFSNANMNY